MIYVYYVWFELCQHVNTHMLSSTRIPRYTGPVHGTWYIYTVHGTPYTVDTVSVTELTHASLHCKHHILTTFTTKSFHYRKSSELVRQVFKEYYASNRLRKLCLNWSDSKCLPAQRFQQHRKWPEGHFRLTKLPLAWWVLPWKWTVERNFWKLATKFLSL